MVERMTKLLSVRTLTPLVLLVLFVGTAKAADYLWTGATNSNLDVDTNWAGGSRPAGIGTDQPSTPTINDTIVFDSATWTRPPRRLYTRTNRKWGSIVLNNGTISWANDGNNQGNYSWGGTDTLVVGDNDATAAVANFNVTNWNQGGTTGTKTYVVNSDGTLASGRGGVHNWSNGGGYDTVMQLLGGTVDINGQLQESQISGDAGDYVSFEALGSTFTFNQGTAAGRFDELSDVTAQFGDSFRLGGTLPSDPRKGLEATESGGRYTISIGAATNEWQGPSGGSWGTVGNWVRAYVPDHVDDKARFGDIQPGNVVIDTASRTLDRLEFTNTAGSYDIQATGGRTLTAGSISQSNNVSNTISAPLAGGGMTFDIQAGTLDLPGGLNTSGTVDVNVAPTASLNLSGPLNADTLRVNAGAMATGASATVNALDLSAGGTVNTGGNPVTVTNEMKLPDSITATITGGSFTATGNDLANANAARTFGLSGGTLQLAAPAGPPEAGLIRHFVFNGGVAADTSGNGGLAGLTAGATVAPTGGKHSEGYLDLSGSTNARLTIGTGTGDAPQLGTSYTLTAWYQNSTDTGYRTLWRGLDNAPSGTGDHQVIVNGGTNNLGVYGNKSGGRFQQAGSATIPGGTGADNTWHFMAVVNDVGTQEFYTDNGSDLLLLGTLNKTMQNNYLGTLGNYLSGSQRFAQKLDDALIYNRALTNDELLAAMAGGGSDPLDLPMTHIAVSAPSALDLGDNTLDHTLGNLTLGADLAVQGANSVSFDAVSGSGALTGPVTTIIRDSVSPGSSTGTLTFDGSLVMDDPDGNPMTYYWELSDAGNQDLVISAELSILDPLIVRLMDDGATPSALTQFDLFQFTSFSGDLGLISFDTSQVDGLPLWDTSGLDLAMDADSIYMTGLRIIPEPGTVAIAALGALGMSLLGRRRRTR